MKHINVLGFSMIMFFVLTGSIFAQNPVGRLSGDVSVNSGKLHYQLPITVPKGIHNQKPNMSVQYRQTAGLSIMGSGFSLQATSRISRCTAAKLIDGFRAGFELNSRTRFCNDGERLVAISGVNGQANTEYRTQIDNNHRYFSRGGSSYTPTYWEKHTPDGHKIRYERIGTLGDLQAYWLMTRVEDIFGNAMTYHYGDGDGTGNTNSPNPLLERIDYSGYNVHLRYEDRQDPVSQYSGGLRLVLNKRLAAIVVRDGSQAMHEYRFVYETVGNVRGSERLASATQCYGVNGSSGCLNPVTFDYQPLPDPSYIDDTGTERTLVIPKSAYDDGRVQDEDMYRRPSPDVADVNNDGLVDFCFYKTGTGIVCALSGKNGGSGYHEPKAWSVDLGYQANKEDYGSYNKLHLIDLNVDGYTDACLLDREGLRCGLNDDGLTFGSFSYWNVFNPASQDPNRRIRAYRSAALNRTLELNLQFDVLQEDREVSFQYINSDEYPDICELRADGAYVCYAGSGTGFSGVILTLPSGTVDSRFVDSELLAVCQEYPQIGACRDRDDQTIHKPLNMLSPIWVDIDGDVDQDLCWLSAYTSQLKCSYASSNGQLPSGAPTMSAPVVLANFNYPLMAAVRTDFSQIPDIFRSTSNVEESQPWQADQLVSQALKDFDKANRDIKQFLAPLRFADLNSDGLPDLCFAETTADYDFAYLCRLNTGAGGLSAFSAAQTWLQLDGAFFYYRADDANAVYEEELEARKAEYQRITSSIQLEDMNYDGLNDFCLIGGEKQKCAYNTVDGFSDLQDRQAIAADIEIDQQTFRVAANLVQKVFGKKTKYHFREQRFAYGAVMSVPDINGDGFTEFCYRSIYGVVCTAKDNFASPNLLIGFTDSYGLHTSIQYDSLVKGRLHLRNRSRTFPSGFVEKPQESWVVKRVTTDTGVVEDTVKANPIRNSESYRYYSHLVNRKLGIAGFNKIFTYEDGRNNRSMIELSLQQHMVGRKLVDVSYVNGKSIKSVKHVYSLQARSHGRFAVLLNRTAIYEKDLDGRSLVAHEEIFHRQHDEFGFAKEIETSRRVYPSGERIRKITRTSFAHDTQSWTLGRPVTQSVEHINDTDRLTRSVIYEYQNGVLKQEILQPDSTTKLVMRFEHDSAGNVIKTITEGLDNGILRQRAVESTYDSKGRVLTETDALGQTVTNIYDPRCGGLQSQSDIAGRVASRLEYDALCRVRREFSIDSNVIEYEYSWADSHANLQNTPAEFPFPYRNPIVYKVVQNDALGQEIATYYDANNQVVKTIQTGFSSDEIERIVVVYHQFDRYGRKTASSVPHYQLEFVPETSWVTVEYDPASRIRQETKRMANGEFLTTNYYYSGLSTTIEYDNYRKTTTNGVHGKPIQIDENGLLVNFQYNPLGELTGSAREGVISELAYNERGFKIRQKDPAMGTWNYEYNAFGDIIRQVDAEGQEIRYTYDNLGRVATRSDATQGIITWTYNTSGNGIGQLDMEANADKSVVKIWIYDELGRTTGELLKVDNQEFPTQYVYDEYSRLISTVHPNNLRFDNDYDNVGNVQRITVPGDNIQGYDHLKEVYKETLRLKLQVSQKLKDVKDLLRAHQENIDRHQEEIDRLEMAEPGLIAHRDALKVSRDKQQAFISAIRTKANELNTKARTVSNNSNFYFKRRYCSTNQCFWEFKRGSTTVPIPTSWSVDAGGKTATIAARINYCKTDYWDNSLSCDKTTSSPSCRTVEYDDYYETVCTRVIPRSAYTNAVKSLRVREIAENSVLVIKDRHLARAEDAIKDLDKKIEDEEEFKTDDITARDTETTKIDGKDVLLIKAEGILGGKEIQYAEELDVHRRNLHMLLGIDIPQDATLAELDSLYAGAVGSDDNTEKRFVVWAATLRNAHGQLQSEIFGNGLRTEREYSLYNGALQSIKTNSAISGTLRNIQYRYYANGLISDKEDFEGQYQTTEHYDYDQRQQLVGWTFSGLADQTHGISVSRTYQYDDRGNMEQRETQANIAGVAYQTTDWLSYNSANQLMNRSSSTGGSVQYQYDNNGNMLTGDGRSFAWSAFNKATSILGGSKEVLFDYDAARKRLVKRSIGETVYYINPGYERVVRSGEIIHRHHIRNGNDIVATFEKRENSATSLAASEPNIAYYHRDSLGSGELITDHRMKVIERRYYSPFGEQVTDIVQAQLGAAIETQTHALEAEELQNYLDALASHEVALRDDPVLGCLVHGSDTQISELRGFTSHEQIKEFNLVNMNARLYDPVIARFVSADSIIPEASMPLAHNRYAYVLNNPISYRDPTGHFPWLAASAGGLFIASQLSNNPNHQAIGQIAAFAYLGEASFLQFQSKFMSAAALGFAQNLIATGDLSSSIEAAAFAALSASLTADIKNNPAKWDTNDFTRAITHGFAQGFVSELRGDKFGHGFVAGFMSKAGSAAGREFDSEYLQSAIVGAFAFAGAEATGGDGIKAAITAGLVHLYNEKQRGKKITSSGNIRRAQREELNARGSKVIPHLKPGVYGTIKEALAIGPFELSDTWVIDVDNKRVLQYRSIGAGMGLAARVALEFGAIYTPSAEAVTGPAISLDVDGTLVFGGSGTLFGSSITDGTPKVSGGPSLGFSVGAGGFYEDAVFLKVYSFDEAPFGIRALLPK